MRTLSKTKPFYVKALSRFRKQYKDVIELLYLYGTQDKKICGGEWIDSKGVINIADSIDNWERIKIVE